MEGWKGRSGADLLNAARSSGKTPREVPKEQARFLSLPQRPVSGVYPQQAAGDALRDVLGKAAVGGELGQDPFPCDLPPRGDGMCRDPAWFWPAWPRWRGSAGGPGEGGPSL